MIYLFLIVLDGVSNFSYSMLMGYRFKKEPFYRPDTEVNIFSEVLFTYLQHELVKEETVIATLKDIFDEDGFLKSEQAFEQYSVMIDESKALKNNSIVQMVICFALVNKKTVQKYKDLKFNFIDFKRLMYLTGCIPTNIKIYRGNYITPESFTRIHLAMRWVEARTVSRFLNKKDEFLVSLNVPCFYYFLDASTAHDKKNKEICEYIFAAWQNRIEQEGSIKEMCWHEWTPSVPRKSFYTEKVPQIFVKEQVRLLKKRLNLLPKSHSIAAFRTAYWLKFSQNKEYVLFFEKECADHGIQVTMHSDNAHPITGYLVCLKQ